MIQAPLTFNVEPRMQSKRSIFIPLLFCVVACSAEEGGPLGDPVAVDNNANAMMNAATADGGMNAVQGCAPAVERWDDEVSAIVETHCGTCHGDEPNYGAPYTLTSYQAMTAARGEFLTNELAAARVAFGEMPPAGLPDLPDADVATLVEWASCGEITPELGTGLKVDRPVFLAPDESPEGLAHFDVRADDFSVGADVVDLYQCFTFDAPIDADQFVRRIEVVVDQSEVLHHVVLLRDPERNAPDGRHVCPGMPQNSDYLYAWAPGGGPIEFPDGGLRVSPGERFVLQIHYNNAIGKSDVVDTSGVRLFHDDPSGNEYGMVAPGPLLFSVPPSAVQDVTGECAITQEMTVLAGMPHMHEIGNAFTQILERADGTTEPVITLQNWQFETQLFYSMPLAVHPGDVLRTTCTFDNPTSQTVRSGERTGDEMCFNFMYVTPPPPTRYCDTRSSAPPSDIAYQSGECLASPPIEAPNLAIGTFVFDAVPPATGGMPEPGTYELTGYRIHRESASTPVGDIDADASQLLAKGQLVVTDTELVFDANYVGNTVSVDGQTFPTTNAVSISGTPTVDGTTLTLDLACPSSTSADFEISVERRRSRIAASG